MVNALANVIVTLIFLAPFITAAGLVLAYRGRKVCKAAEAVEARRRADLTYWLNRWRCGPDVALAADVLEALGFPVEVLTIAPPADPYKRHLAVRREMWSWEDPSHPVAVHRLGLLDPGGHIQRQIRLSEGAARMGFAVQW